MGAAMASEKIAEMAVVRMSVLSFMVERIDGDALQGNVGVEHATLYQFRRSSPDS